MLFPDGTEILDRENDEDFNFEETFYNLDPHGENKSPPADSSSPQPETIQPQQQLPLLDPGSQFTRDFFDFFNKSPLMTRSNSNSSTLDGLRHRSPFSKDLLQREDSLNEIIHVIKNDERNPTRPGNLRIGGAPQDIEPWLAYLERPSPVLAPKITFPTQNNSSQQCSNTPEPKEPALTSPEPQANFSWNINGVRVKLEPQTAGELRESRRLEDISERPASAFPLGEGQPPRPFSVSSLPPDSHPSARRKRRIKVEADEDDELPPPRKYSRRKPVEADPDEDFEEWRKRRDRNNDAVRRARAKKKAREMMTEQRCEALEEEVERLCTELDAERKKRIALEQLLQQQKGLRKK